MFRFMIHQYFTKYTNHFKVFPIFFTLPTPSPPIPCALGRRRNHPELRAASGFEGLTLQADGLGKRNVPGSFRSIQGWRIFQGDVMGISWEYHGNMEYIMEIWNISWKYGIYHGNMEYIMEISWEIWWELWKYDGKSNGLMNMTIIFPSEPAVWIYGLWVLQVISGSQRPTIPNRHMYGLGLPFVVPSGEHTKSYRKSPFFIDKPSISMGHGFHSYVSLPKGISSLNHCSFRVYFDLLRLSSSFYARSLKNSPSFKTIYLW